MAWLGHATVLINFFGIKILTDPVLFPRIGIRLPGLTLGPKRLTAPALTVRDLPKIDIVLLSHAHFDHFDMRTLHRFHRSTTVITAQRTSDLLRLTRFRDVSELGWKERKSVTTFAGKIDIVAFRVKHWGARTRRDTYRGYNGYVLERNDRRILFGGLDLPLFGGEPLFLAWFRVRNLLAFCNREPDARARDYRIRRYIWRWHFWLESVIGSWCARSVQI